MREDRAFAIHTEDLRRDFYPHHGFFRKGAPMNAVDGVNLSIEPGTVFGLLGPNGAGKTTTIKMISTLLLPTSGRATVAGFDVVQQEVEVRRRLGVLLGGERGLYNKLTAVDNLRYFAALYGVPLRDTETRIQQLLDLTGLAHRQRERVEGFSRGMKQRIHLSKALIHEPEIVILDEPTIGLDPDAAVQLRNVVRQLVPERTVLLTTHYLAEADELCDRIAIIDHGRIIAEDTPRGIKRLVGGGSVLEISIRGNLSNEILESLRDVSGAERIDCRPGNGHDTSIIEVSSGSNGLIADPLLRRLVAADYSISEVRTRDVTLEEAFLALTGNGARDRVGVAL